MIKSKLSGLLNLVVALLGVIFVFIGRLISSHPIIMTFFLSVGTSLIASAIVSWLNSKYLMKNDRIKFILTQWQVISLYKTKAEMNEDGSNIALENCKNSIDIIAEGMHNFLSVKKILLQTKISSGVAIRIISCDNNEMLLQRARDESLGGTIGNTDPSASVMALNEWVNDIRKKHPNSNISIRFHSSYPGISYMKVDSNVFISPNLWLRPSQQSFAIHFSANGIGGAYFSDYFEELWESSWFTHNVCNLKTDYANMD